MLDFSGNYLGEWVIDQSNSTTTSKQKKGKSVFSIKYNQSPIITKQNQIDLTGLLYEGKFRENALEVFVKLDSQHAYSINLDNGSILMDNVTLKYKYRRNFQIQRSHECKVNINLLPNQQEVNVEQQTFLKAEDEQVESKRKEYKMDIILFQTEEQKLTGCKFEDKIEINLTKIADEEVMEKISNYSFFVTALCMIFIYTILGQIKKAMDDESIGQIFSLQSILLSIIWNFIYFVVHMQISMQQPAFHYLSMPAFWFFMISFIFQFRFFIICWKSQNLVYMNDAVVFRRKIIGLYARFYIFLFLFYILHQFFLFNKIMLLLTNATIWIPQIYRNYTNRTRRIPDLYYMISLSCLHMYYPSYIYGCPKNFLDNKPNFGFLILYLSIMIIQIVTIMLQKKQGPRFFVPLRLRMDPNAYNYYFKFQKQKKTQDDQQEIIGNEDCVICMNQLYIEIDQFGRADQTIDTSEPANIKKAKYYMKTPCNHKYHVICLKKWMEIRLECPSCRQIIPPLPED